MELKVMPYEQPAPIRFNFEELKTELAERVHIYEVAVYDDTQIKQAKADKADLNKLKKALNDERIRREREYMAPFAEFKAQVAEIISIIDKPVALIDKQVKDYENRKKEEKRAEITAFFNYAPATGFNPPEWLKLDQIWDERWLNASVNMATVKKEIITKIEDVNKCAATLTEMPEIGPVAYEVYKNTLDMTKAVNEANKTLEIQRAVEEAKRAKEEQAIKAPDPAPAAPTACQPAEPVAVWDNASGGKTWVKFEAHLSADEAKALKVFFEANNIEFRPI